MEHECGCGGHHQGHHGYWGPGRFGGEEGYRRHFLTKAEKAEKLKNYAEDLKKELKAVEERIKEMQS